MSPEAPALAHFPLIRDKGNFDSASQPGQPSSSSLLHPLASGLRHLRFCSGPRIRFLGCCNTGPHTSKNRGVWSQVREAGVGRLAPPEAMRGSVFQASAQRPAGGSLARWLAGSPATSCVPRLVDASPQPAPPSSPGILPVCLPVSKLPLFTGTPAGSGEGPPS